MKGKSYEEAIERSGDLLDKVRLIQKCYNDDATFFSVPALKQRATSSQ